MLMCCIPCRLSCRLAPCFDGEHTEDAQKATLYWLTLHWLTLLVVVMCPWFAHPAPRLPGSPACEEQVATRSSMTADWCLLFDPILCFDLPVAARMPCQRGSSSSPFPSRQLHGGYGRSPGACPAALPLSSFPSSNENNFGSGDERGRDAHVLYDSFPGLPPALSDVGTAVRRNPADHGISNRCGRLRLWRRIPP
ncbi:hypothetical protein F4780DRAFT_224008 [Xylariomycetidae sp. FL0641]|nr:hypothetical protein F4780DRAFT_224008 [Xylariomycetidae sp. FL0641]